MKKRDTKKQASLQKRTTKRAHYEKTRRQKYLQRKQQRLDNPDAKSLH